MRALRCAHCGRVFVTINSTQKRCRVCEFESKGDYDLALAEEAWLSGYELGYQRGAGTQAAPSPPQMTLPLLNEAIRLCHPDRHPAERFAQANAVTAALNAARDKLAGTATR